MHISLSIQRLVSLIWTVYNNSLMPKTIIQFVSLQELVFAVWESEWKISRSLRREETEVMWWLVGGWLLLFWFLWQSINWDDDCACCVVGKLLEGCVDAAIIVDTHFFHHTSSTIPLFTSHREMFDNNKPWEWVSLCIFDVSMSFILFYFVSNPMNWLSFLGCFYLMFCLDRLFMFLLLVNWLCFMFDCWM